MPVPAFAPAWGTNGKGPARDFARPRSLAVRPSRRCCTSPSSVYRSASSSSWPFYRRAYHRTGEERWLRLTKYYGRAMVIVFAVGVVTGLMQTFQFGMNWAGFSRYVGDVFGAPLALEGLAAFFVESVFLGLWIFGAGKLRPRVHLACLWVAERGDDDQRLLDPRRQLVDAEPRRLRDRRRSRAADGHLRGDGQLDRRPDVRARAVHLADDGRGGGARDRLRADRAWAGGGRVRRCRADGGVRGPRRRAGRRRRRALPGRARARAAADEDGRGRGALRDRGARRPVAVRARRGRHRPRPAVPEHQGPGALSAS